MNPSSATTVRAKRIKVVVAVNVGLDSRAAEGIDSCRYPRGLVMFLMLAALEEMTDPLPTLRTHGHDAPHTWLSVHSAPQSRHSVRDERSPEKNPPLRSLFMYGCGCGW
jgi:hypothetical protein